MFLVSLLFVLAFSYLVAALLGVGAYFLVIAFALIVLNVELLSLFGAISPVGILVLNALNFALALVFWLKKGRPLLKININFKKYLNAIKLDKSLALLSLGFLVLMSTALVLALFTPVNDPDAQAYHALRAVVFAQQGSLAHFEIADIRNLVMPINSEIFYTWLYSLTGKDLGFGVFSYLSYVLGLTSLWGILSHFGYSFRKKLWCVFMLSSLAGIISQISSTQTDVTIGALFLAALLFYLKSDKGKHYLYFSTLCLALALGTKTTAFLILLPFLVLFWRRDFKLSLLFLTLNFLVFSSYNYVLNFVDFGNPFGSLTSVEMHRFFGGYKAFLGNFVRYITQFFDFAGFTWGYYLGKYILGAQAAVLSFLHIPPELGVVAKMDEVNTFLTEQTLGFGVLGFLAFLPCALLSFKNKKVRPFAAVFFLSLLMLCGSLGYMVFSIRFIAAFVVLASPVFVLSYFKKMNPLKFFFVLFMLFYMVLVSTHLSQRPYFKLLKAYRETGNFEQFADKVRCFDTKLYRGYPQGCLLRDYMLAQKPKRVAFFSDAYFALMPLKLGEVRVDTLLLEKLSEYDFSLYDMVILPASYQLSNADYKKRVFNYKILQTNDGPQVHFSSNALPLCIFYDRNDFPTTSSTPVVSKCYLPKEYFMGKGFSNVRYLNIELPEIYKDEKNDFYVFKKI